MAFKPLRNLHRAFIKIAIEKQSAALAVIAVHIIVDPGLVRAGRHNSNESDTLFRRCLCGNA